MRWAALFAFAFGALAAHADLNDPPPRAALIDISVQDASAEVAISGAAGSVAASSTVICINLDTGHYATTTASSSGSFSIPRLYAPAGTFILVKVDRSGGAFDPFGHALVRMAGTILRIPDPPPRDGVERFGGASLVPGSFSVPWRFEGSAIQETGGLLIVRGTVIIDSPAADTAAVMRVTPRLTLDRCTLADGWPMLAQATYASTLVTPTGFPIERTPFLFTGSSAQTATLQRTAPGRAEAQIEVQYRPPVLGDGYYRAVLAMQFEGVADQAAPDRPMLTDIKAVDRASRKTGKYTIYGPLMRIGNPALPRLPWMILANHVSEGTRGATAVEDRKRFAFAPRVVTQSDTLILPRVDPVSGQPIRYRIEPFAPTIGLGDRELPSPPSVPFRFPSGSLRAEITHPDGRVSSTSALPFVQSRSINLLSPSGQPLDRGGGYPHDPYQLSTMDPSLELTFEADGKYVVRLDGWIEDVWGNRWSGSGTYEVLVARTLVLDTAVLPGTPFETGDVLNADVQIIPPVPADVEVRVELFADSDPSQRSVVAGRGHANRFGHCRIEGIPLSRRGEYRVDAIATWRDGAGDLWAGARTWGSVVAPRDAALVAHGNRGVDDMPEPRPIWYRLTGATGSGHIQIPFLGGDVLWATELDAAIPHITWEDPGRVLSHVVERGSVPASMRTRYQEGSTPPALWTSTGVDAHLDPAAIDVWSYAYRSVQRPLVRVREIVGEETGVAGYYWRFSSAYGGQRGVGNNGDLANDFKFQFGGMVVRGSFVGTPQYAVYGSFFVLVPEGDPDGARVMPPFRANGGGPDGGPLFRLKGKEIDLFFHPTALRPGSILHRGERISLTGYSGPTLPSKIEATFTSPAGKTSTVLVQANKVGYFNDPAADFTAGESGVWKARVKILFDGRASAGQVSEPFPSGDVLGSREGEFYFYVVDSNAAQLEMASMPKSVRPADGPITFTAQPPSGLTNVQLTYTTTMPGFILEEKTQTSMKVIYDAPTLALDFPNLDLHDGDGRAGVDTITISMLLSGTDGAGKRRHFARQIVIQGEEVQMPDQHPRPKRRGVRK